MCSVTAFFLLSFFGQLVVASMAVADLKKSLDSLERSQKLIAQLALATDKDVCREKIQHELIVYLRGPAVGEVQQLFDDHVKSKESVSNERAKKSRNSAGDDPAACALADAEARNTYAAQTLRVKFWTWFLQCIKLRSTAAEEARAQMAVAAASKLHSLDGQIVLHAVVFTAVNHWSWRLWRRFGTSVWISLSLAMGFWPCSFCHTTSSRLATRTSLSTRLPRVLAPWPRKFWTSRKILDLGDPDVFDVVVQCVQCFGHLPVSFAELNFLMLDHFAHLFPGLLGGWSWSWLWFGVQRLFPCHFGRGVQFTFGALCTVEYDRAYHRRRRHHTHGSHDLPYWLSCSCYFAHCLQMWFVWLNGDTLMLFLAKAMHLDGGI